MTLTEGLLAPHEPLAVDEMFKEGLTILTSTGATFIFHPGGLDLVQNKLFSTLDLLRTQCLLKGKLLLAASS